MLLSGPRDDIPAVLAALDAFVHPAIAESFGMVIVEAMAMARPVLSTPVGIAPEVIMPGETGLLCVFVPTLTHWLRGLCELMTLRPSWPGARGGGAPAGPGFHCGVHGEPLSRGLRSLALRCFAR